MELLFVFAYDSYCSLLLLSRKGLKHHFPNDLSIKIIKNMYLNYKKIQSQ